MNIKNKIYNTFLGKITKALFLKTPLFAWLRNRMRTYRFRSGSVNYLLDRIFWEGYFNQLEDPLQKRAITDSTLVAGEGRKWAEKFYGQGFRDLKDLKERREGLLSAFEAHPIYGEIIQLINNEQLSTNTEVHLIQVGSCSGTDLRFFHKMFPALKYISTDINDEIIEFQREKYDFDNFYFFKCHAEDIDLCIERFDLSSKRTIIFSVGSLQYLDPHFLEVFFNKLKLFESFDLFIQDTVDLPFIKSKLKERSKNRASITYSHRYGQYANDYKILKDEVVEPYAKNDLRNQFTGHYFLHVANQ